jgi:hypothetical protein
VDIEKQFFKDMALLHWKSAVIKTLYFLEQMDLMHACESWEVNASLTCESWEVNVSLTPRMEMEDSLIVVPRSIEGIEEKLIKLRGQKLDQKYLIKL